MIRTVCRRCLTLFLLIITIHMIPIPRFASYAASKDVWQSSQAPVVQLGVRNKYGNRDKYTAVWTVSAPDGSLYKARTTVESDNWGSVWFPDDFPTYRKPGRYTGSV